MIDAPCTDRSSARQSVPCAPPGASHNRRALDALARTNRSQTMSDNAWVNGVRSQQRVPASAVFRRVGGEGVP
jgi:hypothetical protein